MSQQQRKTFSENRASGWGVKTGRVAGEWGSIERDQKDGLPVFVRA